MLDALWQSLPAPPIATNVVPSDGNLVLIALWSIGLAMVGYLFQEQQFQSLQLLSRHYSATQHPHNQLNPQQQQVLANNTQSAQSAHHAEEPALSLGEPNPTVVDTLNWRQLWPLAFNWHSLKASAKPSRQPKVQDAEGAEALQAHECLIEGMIFGVPTRRKEEAPLASTEEA
jgi:hypothetical protein